MSSSESFSRPPSLDESFLEAVALHRAGHLKEAEELYRAVLASQPTHPDANHNLGVVSILRGRPATGLSCLKAALEENPGNGQYWLSYIEALIQIGQIGVAFKVLEEGRQRGLQGVEVEALGAMLNAQNGNPEKPAPLEIDTLLDLFDQGRFAEAAVYAQTMTINYPQLGFAWKMLGMALQQMGRSEEALLSVNKSVALLPEDAHSKNNQGLVLMELGRLEEAEACFRQAIQINPDDADVHSNLGRLLQQLGKMDEAEHFLSQAITLAPGKAMPLATAILSLPFRQDDPRFNRLEALYAERDTLSSIERINLDFAMGKAMESIGEYDRAYEAYEEGNRLHFKQYPYDENRDERFLEKITGVFNADLINQYTALAETMTMAPVQDERTPIFIVGMMRSGSTLIEQILASHPAIFGAGELTIANGIADSVEVLELLLQDSPNPKANLASLHKLGQEYLRQVWKLAPEAEFITDKQLGNFCHLGLIHLMLPDAKIIHATRDPMDTCFSCYATLFTKGVYYSYDQAALGRHYLFYEKMMQHWHKVLPAGRILDVRYEDNVAQPEREARRILDFLGLPWDPACLRFHETQRVVSTASVVQVRQPLYTRSVARWKRFEQHLHVLHNIVRPVI